MKDMLSPVYLIKCTIIDCCHQWNDVQSNVEYTHKGRLERLIIILQVAIISAC